MADNCGDGVVTKELLMELRKRTSVSLTDCKKAIIECGGNLDEAQDYLRKAGQHAARKRGDRETGEGLVALAVKEDAAVMLSARCETDFVVRNELFQDMATKICERCCSLGLRSVGDLLKAEIGPGNTVEQFMLETAGKFRENVAIGGLELLKLEGEGAIGYYMHQKLSDKTCAKAAIIVLESSAPKGALESLGKELAMHSVACNPEVVAVNDLPEDEVAKERAVFEELARAKASDEAVISKIVEGRLSKYYKEVVMLEQAFAIIPEITVHDVLKRFGQEHNCSVKIAGFAILQVNVG